MYACFSAFDTLVGGFEVGWREVEGLEEGRNEGRTETDGLPEGCELGFPVKVGAWLGKDDGRLVILGR